MFVEEFGHFLITNFWDRIFGLSSSIFGFKTKNNLVRLWSKPELLGHKSTYSDQFWPIYGYLKFKTSEICSNFGQIWQLFFFKMQFCAKLVLEPLKMSFSEIVQVLKMVYIDFLPFKILSFSAFFMLKSVVLCENHLAKGRHMSYRTLLYFSINLTTTWAVNSKHL